MVLPSTAQRDSFDEEALEKEEHHYHRQYDQTRSRHQQVELNSMHGLEELQAERQGVHLVTLQIDQGTKKIVPRVDTGQSDNDERRAPGASKEE